MFQRDPAHGAFVAGRITLPSGSLKWRFDTEAPIFSSPAVVGDRLYLSTGDGRVLALYAASGDLLWEYGVGAPVNSSPAVAGDLVFVGLRDGRVLALNREAGDLQWEFKTGELVYSSPAVYEGVLYIGSGDGRLYALDATSGQARWSYLTGGRVTSGPAVNREVTAFVSQDRYLYLIDTSTGRRRLDFPTSPVRGGANNPRGPRDRSRRRWGCEGDRLAGDLSAAGEGDKACENSALHMGPRGFSPTPQGIRLGISRVRGKLRRHAGGGQRNRLYRLDIGSFVRVERVHGTAGMEVSGEGWDSHVAVGCGPDRFRRR